MESLIAWLLSDGVGVIVGFVLANLLEPMPAWQALDSYRKRLSVMALTIGLAPLLALGLYWLLTQAPPDRLTVLTAFQAGFVAFTASQYGHASQLKASGLRKELGDELLTAYQNNLGPGNALTSDGQTRFAYTAQRLAEKALDTRAHS